MRRIMLMFVLSAMLVAGIALCQSSIAHSDPIGHRWSSLSSPVSLPLMKLMALSISIPPPSLMEAEILSVRHQNLDLASSPASGDIVAHAAVQPPLVATPPMTTTTTSVPVIAQPAPPVTATTASSGGYTEAQWQLVSNCENAGSWVPVGSAYPDGVGIDSTNWYANGGTSDYSPAATVIVGNAFLAANGMTIPDQNGCGGGY